MSTQREAVDAIVHELTNPNNTVEQDRELALRLYRVMFPEDIGGGDITEEQLFKDHGHGPKGSYTVR